ncbi:MAG: tRNA lysidine(34) synthetase TilS, partial [Verrucomicrobia bacterium]|nr:tRNA lysidine(34) synthetase TilS [Verrucomicrobiota bacterium]
VAGLARHWKLKFVGAKVNVPVQARRRGISLEMAGRSARYAFFAKAARTHHCDAVATAHTANDQAETILLNLARGAGAAGLAGIPYMGRHALKLSDPGCAGGFADSPSRSAMAERGAKAHTSGHGALKVVRPLRDVSRESVERFLASGHLAWREDVTNADPAFLRNRVRHEVLPFLEQRLNPGIRLALLRASDILTSENEWLNVLAAEIFGQCRGAVTGYTLEANRLSGFPVAARRRVLRHWLEACGLDAETLSFDAIERLDNLVTDRRGGRAVTLSGGVLVRRHGDKLELSMDGHGNCKKVGTDSLSVRSHGRTAQQAVAPYHMNQFPPWRTNSRSTSVRAFSVRLVVPGETRLPGQGCRIFASIGPGIVKQRSLVIGALPARASLSLRAWRKRRLLARSWKPGDRMRPLGMQGTKKLQDIFSDGKVPVTVRHCLPVIECGGEIVWIPGFRIAQGWEVRPDEPSALQLAVDA